MFDVGWVEAYTVIGPRVVFFSTPPYHGTLTRFHAHPAAWLHKLPDNMTFEEGSLCEPLAVALAGLEKANVKLGDPVAIWCVPSSILHTSCFLRLISHLSYLTSRIQSHISYPISSHIRTPYLLPNPNPKGLPADAT